MKKKNLWIAVAFLLFAVVSPFHLTNEYLRSSDFDTVTVKQNDSVWNLARRYTENESRAEELQQAIIEVNGLNPDGSNLRVGQQLQVPVIRNTEGTQLAEK
ncbi:LysM peptidoglycan-binding domain-containing protein [Selenomonas sp.]|uniref:LysM peptidoglycan-binding domain-containing protein n=1 Tax=Selenomonas sp. TaxID=2053611 RepID=UPI0025DC17D8|nr:LysM peptidoglycan-binding domain-containing protein [Selenomonas sp.]MBQ1867202.1 LysM peptidoglycan-binding domain-containing protein [Selenomonas sp.]